MNMTEQERQDFIKSFTEMIAEDKNFGEVIRKINVGNENVDTKNMSKEEKVAKFFNALVSGDMRTAKSISGSTDAILVPSEFRADVINRVEKQPLALRNYVNVIPTTKRSGEIPVVDGGIVMKWADSDSKTEEGKKVKPQFSSVEYTVHRLEAYTVLAKDTLADSPIAIYSILLDLYADALVQAENEAIIKGTGSKMPKGFINDIDFVEISGTKQFDEIIALQYAIPASKRNGAVYIASPLAVLKMRTIKGADGKYLWCDGNMAGGQLPTFNGYKVLEIETVKTDEDKEAVVFANLKDYMLVDRQELATEINTTSDAAFFGNASIVKMSNRLDGLVTNEKGFAGAYFA